MFSDADVAGPPSPAYPFSPFPAIVVIRPVPGSRRRIRWLSRSQKYSAPSAPKITPYGLFTCWSEKPGVPVPTSVETTAAARARPAAKTTSSDCNRLRREMFMAGSSRSAALLEPLARLVDIAVKHEQAVAVRGGRIAEFELLAFDALHFQCLGQVVHFEDLEIRERQREAVVLVVALVAQPLRCGDET